MKKFTAIIMIVTIIMISLIPLCSVNAQANPLKIYVDATCSDTNAGTKESPFATIEKAKQYIRSLKQSSPSPGGYEVYIRGGVYEIGESLEFTSEDSGTADAPITYRAYGNEKVDIVGGKRISGGSFNKATNSELLDTLADQNVRNNIYYFDLKTLSLTDFGERYLRGAYSYSGAVKEGLTTKPTAPAMELFCNDSEMMLARYPNGNEFMRVGEITQPGHNSDDKESPPYTTSMIFAIDDARAKAWESIPENKALLFGLWKFDWADQTIPLKSVKDGVITTQWSSSFGLVENARFYIYDLFEEIDSPGEYYIDRENGIVYLYPPKNNIGECEFTLSILDEPVINIKGAEYLKFKNINILASRDKAIYASGSNNTFEGLTISNTSSVALDMVGKNNVARDCVIYNTNGGISTWGGSISELIPGNNLIENNHIYNYSRLSKTYASAITLGGVGNIAQHNEIHGAPHQAVSLGGMGQKLMYNEIYDVVRESDDAGAIYCGLTWIDRGHEIKYNYMHDIASTTGGGTGISAVYGDGGQCELYIEGNVVENLKGYAFKINGGQDNVIKNNIVINSGYGLFLSDDMLKVDLTKKHIPEIEAADYIYDCVWYTKYPKLNRMIEDEENIRYPIGNLFASNLMYKSSAAYLARTAGNYIDVSRNLVTHTNPGFKDEANKDWTLREDSEMYKSYPDFAPVPFSEMKRFSKITSVFGNNSVAFAGNSPLCLINNNIEVLSQSTYCDNSTVYIPVTYYAKYLGYTVYDSQNTITISKTGGTSAQITVGSSSAKLDGNTVALNMAPITNDGVVMLSAEDMALLFGKQLIKSENGALILTDKNIAVEQYEEYIRGVYEYITRTLEYKE